MRDLRILRGWLFLWSSFLSHKLMILGVKLKTSPSFLRVYIYLAIENANLGKEYRWLMFKPKEIFFKLIFINSIYER